MNRNKVLRVIFMVIICITCISLVIINFKVNNFNNDLLSMIKDESRLKTAIQVNSDGVKIATLDDKAEIKSLLDMVRSKFIQTLDCKEDSTICLKSNITYVYKEVSEKEIKKPSFYIDNITKGEKSNWKIKFDQRKINNTSNVLSRGCISSGFGMRYGRMHNGIDIAAPLGTNIHSVSEGRVIYSGWQKGYGKIAIIRHKEKLDFVYAHCSELLVSENQLIKKGDVIAKVGSTGRSTGPHVHFEVRKNGVAINPECYLTCN